MVWNNLALFISTFMANFPMGLLCRMKQEWRAVIADISSVCTFGMKRQSLPGGLI